MGKNLPIKLVSILVLTLALSACQKQFNDAGQRMGLIKSNQQPMIEGSNYYEFPEFSPGKQYKSESSFCYKVQTDILCYDKPRKGWEDRLVGYQEPLRPKRPQNGYNTISYNSPDTSYSNNTVPNYIQDSNVSSATPFASQSVNVAPTIGVDSKDLAPLPTVNVQ